MSQLQQRLQQMHQMQMQEMEQILQHQMMLQQQQQAAAAAAGSMPPPMLPHQAAAAAAAAHRHHGAAAVADASTLDYFATGLAASAGLGIPGMGPIPSQQHNMGGPDMGGGPPHANAAAVGTGGFGARAGGGGGGSGANGNYPLTDIDHPAVHDVMCGRGGGANNHIGNVQFRQLVNGYKLKYLAATKAGKPEVAREVVRIWRSLQPPGRFLAKVNPEDDNSLWYDVGDHKAREKASQCLRERTRGTPDLQKYLKELEAQKKPDAPKSEAPTSADPSTVLSSAAVTATAPTAPAGVQPSTSPPPTSAKLTKAQKKDAVEERIAAAAGRTISMGVERAKKDAMSRASDAASQASSSRASKSKAKGDDDDFDMDDPSVVTSNIGSIATASTESAGLDQDEAAQRRREIRRLQRQQQTQLNLQNRLKKMQDAAQDVPMAVPSSQVVNLVSIAEHGNEDANPNASKKKETSSATDKAAEDERRRQIMENATPSSLTANKGSSSKDAPQPDRVPSEGTVVPPAPAPPSLGMDIDNSSLWARIVDVLQNPLMDLPDDAPFEENGPDLSSPPPRQSTSPTPVSHRSSSAGGDNNNNSNNNNDKSPKVAPSLIKGLDNGNDDGFGDDFTLEDYQNSLRAFLTTAPSGSSICGTSQSGDDDYGPSAPEFDRSGFMDSMKSQEWMKTFHSLDSNSSTNNASVTLTDAAMSTRSGISGAGGGANASTSNMLRASNATMPSGNLSGEGQEHYVANGGGAAAPTSPVAKPRPGLLRQKYSDKTFPSIESSVFMSTDNSLKLIDEDKPQHGDGAAQPDIVYEPAPTSRRGSAGAGGGGAANRSVGRQPRRASATRSEKMRSVLGTHSNMSMMSDLTGDVSWSTSHRSRAGTAGTMPPPPAQQPSASALYKRSNTGNGNATTSSNVSVMSEMSDISDRMLMMDLAQGSVGGSVEPH